MDNKIDYHLKALFLTIGVKANGNKKVKRRMGEITIKIINKVMITMTKIKIMTMKKKMMIFMQEIDNILHKITAKTKNNHNR